MTTCVTKCARGKVNLALSVGPARLEDGLHPIASWMARIDLADTVTVSRVEGADSGGGAVGVRWAHDAPRPTPIDWAMRDDLAARAHRAVEALAGRPLPASIDVEKRIPVGGGLGGGSADAAAVMLALDELFGLGLGREALAGAALALGSDVPYCLHDGPAVVLGVGGEVEPTRAVGGRLVLVLPSFGCGTGAVYRAYDAAPVPLRASEVRAFAARGGLSPGELFNDLSGPACEVEPRLGDLLARLGEVWRGVGVRPLVTGSGSTVFGVCPEGTSASAAAEAARSGVEGVSVVESRLADSV